MMPLQSNYEWEKLAQEDPLHAIASEKGKRLSQGGWSQEDFFAKGESYIQLLSPGISKINPGAEVLEIGCGAGRISRALSKRFRAVVGVDVSETMISHARALCADLKNVEFKVSNGATFPIPDESVNAVVSVQVLQHVDREAIPNILLDCNRVLRVSGVAVLHIPSPSFKVALSRFFTLVPLRRILTKSILRFFPDLQVSRKGFVISQYNTYPEKQVASMLLRAGFRDVTSFRFRPANPLSTVYVAFK